MESCMRVYVNFEATTREKDAEKPSHFSENCFRGTTFS